MKSLLENIRFFHGDQKSDLPTIHLYARRFPLDVSFLFASSIYHMVVTFFMSRSFSPCKPLSLWNEPLPTASEACALPEPPPSPPAAQLEAYHRFLARTMDTILSLILVHAMAYGYWSQQTTVEMGMLVPYLLFSIPLAFVVDAFLFRCFGSTLGKAWIGLRLRTIEGKPLSLGQLLRRNGLIYGQATALCILPFSLFTLHRFYQCVARGEPTSYDARKGWRMEVRPVSERRRRCFYLTFCLLTVVCDAAVLYGAFRFFA